MSEYHPDWFGGGNFTTNGYTTAQQRGNPQETQVYSHCSTQNKKQLGQNFA